MWQDGIERPVWLKHRKQEEERNEVRRKRGRGASSCRLYMHLITHEMEIHRHALE